MNATQNYLEEVYLIEDLNLIQEGFGDFVKKNIGNKAKDLVSKLKNIKNLETFKKITKHVPKMGPQKIDETARKHVSNYAKNKRLAVKELGNVPDKVKAPVASMIAIAAKDDKQLRVMAKQINRQVTDWDQANSNLVVNILLSVIIAAIFSSMATAAAPFGVYMGLFLIIDLVWYIADILWFSKKEVSM